MPHRLRVLELFAGIGGWRVALRSALPADVELDVSAFDSGPHCSEVYERNFGEPCSRRNIEQLGVAALDGFDLWAMSPPCQPFSTTQNAKQRDMGDKRCAALEHLCRTFPRLSKPPKWIVLENVKGFHGSEASVMWRASLESMGFSCRPILLDLAHFGVPNHRTRYYLLAERSARFKGGPEAALTAQGGPPGTSPAVELLPPGILIRARDTADAAAADGRPAGAWVQARRREIEEAHRLARSAATKEEGEAVFRSMRACVANEVEHLRGGAGHDAPLLGDASASWKALPLPRAADDAFLVVAEGGTSGAAQQLYERLSALATLEVCWSHAEDARKVEVQRPIQDYLEHTSAEPCDGDVAELIVGRNLLQKSFAPGLSYVQPSGTKSFCFTGHYGKVMHKSSGSLLYVDDGAPVNRTDLPSAHGRIRLFDPKEILNFLGFPKDFSLGRDLALRHRYKVVGNSIAVTVAADLLRFLLLGEGGARLRRLEQPPPVAPVT